MNALLENEINEEVQQGFKLENIDGVNWAFRKLRAYEAKKAEIDHLREAELERINNWHKGETEQIESNKAYFEGLITEYYMELKRNDPKAKISTPNGKVSTRKSTKWNYTNEAKTIEYLTASGYTNMIRVKQELDKTEIKKQFKNGVNTETGEIIPGITVNEEESINIKVVE